jgi:ribosomal RNA-processing protein 12
MGDVRALLMQIFSAARPALEDDRHPALQKRAYSVVAALLYHHPCFIRGAAAALPARTRLDDLIFLLQQKLVSVAAAARRGRLLCLRHVIHSLLPNNPAHVAVLPSVLGEVMLCCRDSNAKVRASAEAVLGAMSEFMAAGGEGRGFEDDDISAAPLVSQPTVSLTEMFRMAIGGLGASTPHMRAASVSALALLLYNYADRAVVRGMLPALTDSVLLLVKEKSREVAGSVIGFCRVLASVTPPRELAPLVEVSIPFPRFLLEGLRTAHGAHLRIF